ncbi:U3 small nucleolar RNA-associated protein 5 [Pleurostoma richardsiae]|uniref:U3 small nucleolar RNA-associated protein 5 n=1 Tax=Pleurostoma richardsiae TaxID=41990 RepID=A0AA38S247_9PEZI|nr:U3 small nucleolar RNA-associated protein 5 [Pleurostoma richardsiae]
MSTKRKAPAAVVQPAFKQSAKPATKTRIDEQKASVSLAEPAAAEPIEISSDSESNYDDVSELDDDDAIEEREEEGEGEDKTSQQKQQSTPAKSAKSIPNAANNDDDVEMSTEQNGQSHEAEASDDEDTSPTFGDLIRNHETVDVSASLTTQQAHSSTALATPQTRVIAPPSLSSLGTVLSQALRTDDTDLLESCFHTTDLAVVRNTIQRLDSSLAGILLTKLAARIHRRPGRAHSLMGWIQWTLVSHGGALAGQPDMHRRLTELNRVLEERSRGLNSLLALKGKLDMLELQMSLRRRNRSRHASRINGADSEEEGAEDSEEGIVYVEGEEDQPSALSNGALRGDEEDEDDFAVANGDAGDSDDNSEDDDLEGMDLDDGEAADLSIDEDEVDYDDIEESGEEEDESEVERAAPPPKVQKKTKSPFGKRR